MTVSGANRVFAWNDLPDHPTGVFPIARSDDAYQTDRNPNHIAAQSMQITLPTEPQLAASATCAPGAVGILLSGVVLFNALDAPGRDAVAHETQDSCQGHPQETSVYHYHNVSSCVLAEYDSKSGPSKLVGYAVDGFGIYGPRDASGKTLTSADLDACHGITSAVEWEGKTVTMYHYVATLDFPYTIGCLKGSWSQATVMTLSGGPRRQGMLGPRNGGPGATSPLRGGRNANGIPGGGPGRPNLTVASARLGISEATLRRVLGPPPPNLAVAARQLGISVAQLQAALGLR